MSVRELLNDLRTYLQLYFSMADKGAHINLIARINKELAKLDPEPIAIIKYEHAPFDDEFYGGDGRNVLEKLVDLETIPIGTKLYAEPSQQNPLNEELAKPEPEPVARLAWFKKFDRDTAELVISDASQRDSFPVYTRPPSQQKPLSDDEIHEILKKIWNPLPFARAIEKAHGIE